MLVNLLTQYNFSEKEARVYLACLELWTAPASSIARYLWENRITVYSILKWLYKRGLATETIKNKVKYYTVIDPEKFVKNEELKFEKLKEALPELSGLVNAYGNKPKVYFYEWIEWLKNLFKEIILESKYMPEDEFFYSFLGTKQIDSEFQKYLSEEFVPFRLKYKTKTKAIISWNSKSIYSRYNKETHESIIIEDEVFDMANEIVLFGISKVAILMYSSNELSWLVIDSKTLYESLKGFFNLI